MLGVLWADASGIVSLAALAMPPTDVGAQLLGAIIFGGGFAMAALCPGTACVAAASGRRDGVAAIGGIFVGTLLTPLLWPVPGTAATQTGAERRWLPDDLGVPIWVVATAIVLMALAAVRLARWMTTDAPRSNWWRLAAIEAVGLTLALTDATVEGRPAAVPARLAAIAGAIARDEDHVDPMDLAQWIKDGRRGLRVIDVRDGVDTATYVIPGAIVVPLDSLSSPSTAPGDLLVLYSDGGAHAADARGQDERARVRALALWFGGQPRLGDRTAVPTRPTSRVPRPRRRNTC